MKKTIFDGVVASDKDNKASSLLLNHDGMLPIVELSLENVTYTPITSSISGKGKDVNRTTVLSNISTTIAPYKLTAWMGPSGSGKTSLVSVVAGLVDPSDISSGIMKVNGGEGRLPKKMVGVVWQDDLLLSNLTVEETIYFAARLKSLDGASEEDVKMLVEETMTELGLLHIRNNLIGSPLGNMSGISGGERKRTAVAAELVIRPSLLLLDEPTSGLDATTARALIKTLKKLAELGHSVSVVIHQPRTSIFKMVDNLLLLSKGRMVYDGPAASVRNFLETFPTVDPLPPETGIADWISDTIIADETRQDDSVLAENWTKYSKNGLLGKSDHNKDPTRSDGAKMSTLANLNQTTSKFEASFSTQLRLLTQRTVKQRRMEKITKVSILLTLTYLVFTALFWWRLPNTTAYIFERNSLLFFILIAQVRHANNTGGLSVSFLLAVF
jgi:ABC-type multidrug transport system ATPase subunit